MPQVPAIRHDPRLAAMRQVGHVERLERIEPQDLQLQLPDGRVASRRPNWLLIGGLAAALLFVMITVFVIGALVAGSGGNDQTVRELTGLVRELTQEMSAMRDVEAEQVRLEAKQQARSRAEMMQILEISMIGVACLLVLAIFGTYGGFCGLVLGVLIIAGGFTLAIQP